MQETQSRDVPGAGSTDACRKLARLLGADAVAAVGNGSAALEDVVEGRAEGLIVFPIGEEVGGDRSTLPPALDVLDTIRRVTREPESDFAHVLSAAAEGLGVEELICLYEHGGRLQVDGVGPGDRPRTVARGVRAELGALDRSSPLTDATVHQLGVVTGARLPLLAGAFAASDRVELLLAGSTETTPDPGTLAIVGRALTAAREAMQDRDRTAASGSAAERERWAARIHDGVTQAVTAAYLELRRLGDRDDLDPPLADAVAEAAADVRRTLFDLRGILFDLSRSERFDATAGERMHDYVRGVAERWRLSVEAAIDIEGIDETDDRAIEVARQVIREAIANAAKHADATTFRVVLRTEPGRLVVEVLDDGRGYDPASVRETPGHMGLSLIRERVAEAGGTFGIETAPGAGTRVVAGLPRAPSRT